MATCPKCRHRFRFRPEQPAAVEDRFAGAEQGVSSWRRAVARQNPPTAPSAAWEPLDEKSDADASPSANDTPLSPGAVDDATFAPEPTPASGRQQAPASLENPAEPQELAAAAQGPDAPQADDAQEAVPPPTHWGEAAEAEQPQVLRHRLDELVTPEKKTRAAARSAPAGRKSTRPAPEPASPAPAVSPEPLKPTGSLEPAAPPAEKPEPRPVEAAAPMAPPRVEAPEITQTTDQFPSPQSVAVPETAQPHTAPGVPAAEAKAPEITTPAEQPALEHQTEETPPEKALRSDGVRDIWARLQAMDDRKTARPRQHHQRPAEDEPEEPAREAVTDPVPWERQDAYGFFPGLFLTLRKILLQPLDFFGNLPEGRPKSKALVFNLLISEFLLVIDFMWSLAGLRARIGSPDQPDVLGAIGSSPSLGFLMALLLVPLVISVGIYLDAWVTHLLLLLFRSQKKSFDETFRVLCYSAAPTVLTAVPVAGQLLSPIILIWYMALQAIGLKKCHEGAYTQTLAAIFIKWSIYLFVLLAMLQNITPGQ
jgi:hypothetical protein